MLRPIVLVICIAPLALACQATLLRGVNAQVDFKPPANARAQVDVDLLEAGCEALAAIGLEETVDVCAPVPEPEVSE